VRSEGSGAKSQGGVKGRRSWIMDQRSGVMGDGWLVWN
jgi:hypothetical protein